MIPYEIANINTIKEVENFAKFLTGQLGMNFYSEEINCCRDIFGNKQFRIAHAITENDRHNILVNKDLDGIEDKKKLRELINRCYYVCEINGLSFAEMLCFFTDK